MVASHAPPSLAGTQRPGEYTRARFALSGRFDAKFREWLGQLEHGKFAAW